METQRASKRPSLQTTDTLDMAPRLAGNLSDSGVASLDIDALSRQNSTASVPRLNGAATADGSASAPGSTTPSSEEAEDYDSLRPEADALMHGSAGGALSAEDSPTRRSSRRKSIPVRLEKTDKRGRYMLHADDPELREILRRGAAATNAAAPAPAQRSSVRELVFTRRFTTFDRQNAKSHESPFFGFFTLFWLAMALLLLRVAAHNRRTYGSVLGTNEVAGMMFSKDVLLLGVTDGVLCGSTLLGLVLQWAVLKGWIDWERSGYIIQNLWQTAYIGGCVGWTFYRDWPWTHTIFIVLHGMVFLMKQHSYAFYNGYRESNVPLCFSPRAHAPALC